LIHSRREKEVKSVALTVSEKKSKSCVCVLTVVVCNNIGDNVCCRECALCTILCANLVGAVLHCELVRFECVDIHSFRKL